MIDPDAARSILERISVFARLDGYDPHWVGSIPLNVHGPGADADICCCGGDDLAAFKTHLETCFGDRPGAHIVDNEHAGEHSIIARFMVEDLPVEIYGRRRPVETHESYIHWLAEDRLLKLAEPRLTDDVRAAKASGLKTEPAFAQCLKLGGEPYAEMLKLASPGDAALRRVLALAGYASCVESAGS